MIHWLLLIILFPVQTDNAFQAITITFFSLVMFFVIGYRHIIFQLLWTILIMIIPFVIFLIVTIILLPCVKCFSNNNHHNPPGHQNNAHREQNRVERLENAHPVVPNNVPAPVLPEADQIAPNNNPLNQRGLFGQAQRLPTMRVMSGMMKQWKRTYSMKDNNGLF